MNRTLPDLDCACATIRRAARLVTQLYSREMVSTEPGQFALLCALSEHPAASRTAIGHVLGFDKTTLSRNLRLIEKNGWIELVSTEDHRERGYRLTAAGRQVLAESRSGWRRAQSKLRGALAPGEWETMLKMFGQVAGAALVAQHKSRKRETTS